MTLSRRASSTTRASGVLFSFGGAEERDFERVLRFATDFSRLLNFQKHHAEEEKFLKNAGDESSKKAQRNFLNTHARAHDDARVAFLLFARV